MEKFTPLAKNLHWTDGMDKFHLWSWTSKLPKWTWVELHEVIHHRFRSISPRWPWPGVAQGGGGEQVHWGEIEVHWGGSRVGLQFCRDVLVPPPPSATPVQCWWVGLVLPMSQHCIGVNAGSSNKSALPRSLWWITKCNSNAKSTGWGASPTYEAIAVLDLSYLRVEFA